MKKRLQLTKFLAITLLCMTTAFIGLFVACAPNDNYTYTLQSDKVENVFVYQSEFDFDQYFSDTYIKKSNDSGEDFLIPLTSSMFNGEIDTSSVGAKSLVITYNSKTITFEYVVKYKVDFLVDNEIFDTQLVLNKNELDLTKIPTKTGFTFISWQELTNEIDNNVQISALFSEDVVLPPLQTLSAVYGDTLDSLTLPYNKFGAWQFEKSEGTLVGNVGQNNENVKFVLVGGEVFATDTVKINVSKKNLEFSFNSLEFEYDGTIKTPSYQLVGANEQSVNVVFVPYFNGNAVNVGKYDFEYIIDDDNYQGGYVGQFEIVKKYVKIVIGSAEMLYNGVVPTISFNAFDKGGNALSQALIDQMNISVNLLLGYDVGEYDIDLVNKQFDNFEVEIIKGKLTVNRATHNVDVSVKEEQAVYGNSLSQVELISSIQGIGVWEWDNENIVISTPSTFSAKVKFTPTDTKNYNIIEKEITFSVEKKAVQICVLENEFTFDATEKTITYVVNGVLDDDYLVVGNEVKTNAGTYKANLSIQSDKYKAQAIDTRLIIAKASIANFEKEQSLIGEITYDKQIAKTLSQISLSKGYSWVDGERELLIGEHAYGVKFTPADTDNYNVEMGEIVLKVNKAQGVISVDMAENGKYSYNAQNDYKLSISINNVEQQLKIEYLYKDQIVQGLGDAGKYFITIICDESAHYLGATKTLEIEITAIENVDDIANSLNATYLDTLEKFANELPYSAYGVWSWQEALNTEVGNAGKQFHNAIFTPYDDVNYIVRVVTVEFNVAKKGVIVPSLANSTLVYNAQLQKPKIEENALYTIQNNGGEDVGEYGVVLTLKDKDNYTWANSNSEDVTLTFEIVQTENDWVVEPSVEGWTFGEQAKVEMGSAIFGDVTVVYYAGETKLLEKPENAGEYEAVFTVIETDNYKGLTKEISFTIEKAQIKVPENQWQNYNGQQLVANIEDTDLYEVVENNGGKEVGEYDVKVRLINSQNYRWETTVSDVVIVKFYILTNESNNWVVEPCVKNWVFGEQANVEKGKAIFGEEILVKYYSGETELAEMPQNAGEYKAIFIVEETNNYKGLTKEISFTIEKASVAIPTNPASKEYTGQTLTADLSENDLYTIQNNGGKDAGEYSVVLTLKYKDNYTWANSNSEDVTLTFEIVQTENDWVVEPSVEVWSFGEQASVEMGSAVFGDVSVKYYFGEKLLETPKNAGEYRALFTVAETDNYKGLSKEITFTIEKAGVTVPSKPASKEYTGKKLTADVTENDLYTVQNNGGVDAGDYDVIFTLKDSVNYKWADGKDGTERKHIFTITKLINGWITEPSIDKTEWTYGEQSMAVSFGTAKYGEAVAKYYDLSGNEYDLMPTEAGEYQIKFVVEPGASYTGLTKSITFSILPYQLVLSAPQYVDNVFYENTVNIRDSNNFVISAGLNRDVLGEYSYVITKGQALDNGTVKVSVNFIPNDSNNYIAPTTVYATIKVKDVASIGDNTYGSIESALSVAKSGDVIWVIAGEKQAVIAENCTVPAGVTLNVPHTLNQMNADGKATLNGNNYASKPTITIETVITVNENVTLLNYGTIKVAGELSGGGGGHAYAGHTAGKSAKIIMKANAKIYNVGGTINLFGIIVEESDNNGSQVIIEGGNLYMPYVVRDFRGGTYMSNIYKSATAFNEFELRNITSYVIIKNGANLYGYANLYSGEQHNATTISLISTTEIAVLHFNDKNGYLTAKYNIVGGYQGNDAWADGILDLKVYGGATADPMSLKVKASFVSVTVTTKDVFFPLSWRLKVSLFDGNYTMAYKYKLMPGHVFTVGSGATVTIGTLAVYTQQAFNAVPTANVPAPHYKTDIGDAKCIVAEGGTLIVTKAVGGKITISGGTFTNNGSTSVSSAEAIYKGGLLSKYSTQNITLSLSAETV